VGVSLGVVVAVGVDVDGKHVTDKGAAIEKSGVRRTIRLTNVCSFRVSDVQQSRDPCAPITDRQSLIANHRKVSLS
jgi:hypothetical protein